MGTSYSVKLVTDQPLQAASAAEIETAIAQSLSTVDRLMSTYKEDSELSTFNRLPVGQSMGVSQQTFEVLLRSKKMYDLTGGAFDISVSPLVGLWGFGPDSQGRLQQEVPSDQALSEAIANTGIEKLELDLANKQAIKKGAVQLDLSAIAKGFAVDQVAEYLDQLFLSNYLVEVGGELRVKGVNKRGEPWSLGVEVPDSLVRKAHSIVSASSGALATSGDYRNYFEQDGVRYSHLIDPVTQSPIRHRLASVSVLASNCADADALATALMVMGEEKGLDFARRNNLDAMFIYRENDAFEAAYSGRFDEFLVN